MGHCGQLCCVRSFSWLHGKGDVWGTGQESEDCTGNGAKHCVRSFVADAEEARRVTLAEAHLQVIQRIPGPTSALDSSTPSALQIDTMNSSWFRPSPAGPALAEPLG